LLKNPKSCGKCDNLFCSYCIDDALKRNNSCPLCRDNPFKETKMNKVVRNTLNNIEITCPDCLNQKLKMEDLEKHLHVCSLLNRVYYSCELCNKNLKNENELESHKNECVDVNCRCPFCKLSYKRKIISHHIEYCYERLITCNECNCEIPFKIKDRHKDFFCKFLKRIREEMFDVVNTIDFKLN